MTDDARGDELTREIAMTRENIRNLVEEASSAHGEAEEQRLADRIAEQEARLADLLKRRDHV